MSKRKRPGRLYTLGFVVTGNLHAQHRFDALFQLQERRRDRGQDASISLVLSATQARRWWSQPPPDRGLGKGSERLLASIGRCEGPAGRAHLDDRRPAPIGPRRRRGLRAHPRGPPTNHAYGSNRFRLEEAIRGRFPETRVVRLPSLFGPGLKKNVIYDLLNGNQVEKINPTSSFQYYDLGSLWEHVSLVIREGIPVIHLFPEPVTRAEIIDRFFPGSRGRRRPRSGHALRASRRSMPSCSAVPAATSGRVRKSSAGSAGSWTATGGEIR